MTTLEERLGSIRASAWGPLDTVRDAHEADPELIADLASAHLAGTYVLEEPPAAGTPFGLAALVEWVASDEATDVVPFALCAAGTEHGDAAVRNWSAQACGRYPAADVLPFLREWLASPDKSIREGAVAAANTFLAGPRAEPPHAGELLPLLEAGQKKLSRLGKQLAKQALDKARVLAERAPERDDLPAKDDLEALAGEAPADPALRARLVGALRSGRMIPFDQLADACGVSVAEARAIGASVTLDWDPPNVIRWCTRGLFRGPTVFEDRFTQVLGVSPWTVEKLALDARIDDLDAVLAPTPQLVADGKRLKGAPRLRWCTGTSVGDGPQQFLLACFSRPDLAGLTELLVPLLDDDSLIELGAWLLADPKSHAKLRYVLPPSDGLADEIARSYAHHRVEKPWRYEGMPLSPRFRRWAFRWWHEHGKRARDDLRFAFRHGTALVAQVAIEASFPTDEEIAAEAIADDDWWLSRIRECLALAMHGQRRMPMHELRRTYLATPTGRRALTGVVMATDGDESEPFVFFDGDRFVGPAGPVELAGDEALRVAHPLIDPLEGWPASDQTGPDAIGQREAPTYTLADLPDPAALGPVPTREWQERCRRLGYVEPAETNGGTVRAFRELGTGQIVVFHEGYGRGHGRGPVVFTRAHAQRAKENPAAAAALVADVRMLFGLDPLPDEPSAPQAPPPPAKLP